MEWINSNILKLWINILSLWSTDFEMWKMKSLCFVLWHVSCKPEKCEQINIFWISEIEFFPFLLLWKISVYISYSSHSQLNEIVYRTLKVSALLNASVYWSIGYCDICILGSCDYKILGCLLWCVSSMDEWKQLWVNTKQSECILCYYCYD